MRRVRIRSNKTMKFRERTSFAEAAEEIGPRGIMHQGDESKYGGNDEQEEEEKERPSQRCTSLQPVLTAQLEIFPAPLEYLVYYFLNLSPCLPGRQRSRES